MSSTSANTPVIEERRSAATLPIFFAILALGIALRFAVLFIFSNSSRMSGDTPYYAKMALNVLEGHGFSISQSPPYEPFFGRVPSYPLFMAAVWFFTGGENYAALSVVQLILDIGTICLIFLFAQQRFGRTVALWASALYALLPFGAGTAAQYMSEGLSMFLVILALLGHARIVHMQARGRTLGIAVATGVVWGVIVLARPYMAPVAACAGAAIAYELWRSGSVSVKRASAALALVGIGCLAPVSAWALRNAHAAAATAKPFVIFQVWGSAPPHSNLHSPEYRAWRSSYDEPFYWVDWDTPPKANYLTKAESDEVKDLWAYIGTHDGETTPEIRAAFARITAERYSMAPLRLYIWRPISMALKNWLSPRASTLRLSVIDSYEIRKVPNLLRYVFFGLNGLTVMFALIGLVTQSRKHGSIVLWYPLISVTVVLVAVGARETRYNMVVFPVLCIAAALGIRTCALWRSKLKLKWHN